MYTKRKEPMVRIFYLILLLPLLAWARGPADTLKITVQGKGITLEQAFQQVEKQTGYTFVYGKPTLDGSMRVSLDLRNMQLNQVMAVLLKDRNVQWQVLEKNIVLSRRPFPHRTPEGTDGTAPYGDIVMQESVRGQVVDSLGHALVGATVRVLDASGRRGPLATTTDREGVFVLRNLPENIAQLEISFVGYVRQIVAVSAADVGRIILHAIPSALEEVEVMVNTGYQYLPKERATGSFEHIDNALINRGVSTNILNRLENLSPGLLFNHGVVDINNVLIDPFSIRGRSTITANAQPLVVLDDFPYDGDINNINPNDIQSVTILKDAAAASIWGARAGNGVIVITTKKGTTPAPKIELISNISITGRPDLNNIKMIGAADRIEVERFLFENRRYASAANPTNATARYSPIPEAVELMIANPADLEDRLAALASNNVREDQEKYFFRNAVNQQSNINVSGNQERVNYYLSGGLDRNISNLVGERYDRISIRSGNSFQVNDKLKVFATLNFFHVQDQSGNNNGHRAPSGAASGFSPYTKMVDESGNFLPVHLMLRKGFTDTAGNGALLDWTYRPIEEIHNQRKTTGRRDYLTNIGSNYTILPGLDAQVRYQFQSQQDRFEHLYGAQSFYARNLVNDFTQINRTTGAVSYPFPQGAVLHVEHSETTSHQGRGQLNFDRAFGNKHVIAAIGGFEIRQVTTTTNSNQNAGYSEETGNLVTAIDLASNYRRNTTGTNGRVSLVERTAAIHDNFLSYFSNASYSYDQRYTVSGSFRKDEANLFGVDANQKGTPLWALGVGWALSKERFYDFRWLPYLKVRATYGVNGNISRLANAKTTVTLSNGGRSHQLPSALLGSPANRNLSWEKVRQFNFGVDFATRNGRISGNMEYYEKNATNLLAQTPVDPTYGVNTMYMNVADMKGKGIDVQIKSTNLDGVFSWLTLVNYSLSKTEVTNYLMPISSIGRTYLPVSISNPLVSKPLFSVFALPWRGLDAQTGSPVGLHDGEPSMDYNAIYNNTPLEELVFFGTAQPTHFGSVMNTFSYKNFDLSFNISFKAGYFFRRSSLSYTVMFNGFTGHSDFANRWRKPGDEAHTDVPVMVYPANANRDNFYQYAEVLVEKGDHIRLEDLNIGYRIVPNSPNNVFRSVKVFTYMTNLGMIWSANSHGIDPYYNNLPLTRPTFSFGTNITF